MTDTVHTFAAQASSLRNLVLSQEAYLANVGELTGKRAEEAAYPALCTRMNLPAKKAAVDTLESLARLSELLGGGEEGDARVRDWIDRAIDKAGQGAAERGAA